MILYGGNPDLRPEEADTWTAGFEVRPGWLPGLRIGVNGFRTDFDDRIGQPALESILTALQDPSLAPFVRTLDPANGEDLAAIQAILDLPTTGLRDQFPAASYGAIVDARYVNTARVQVRGRTSVWTTPSRVARTTSTSG
ncbi:TonB dependent receptor [compost metagenome]